MHSLLIATTNQAKFNEFRRYRDLPGVEYKTLKDVPNIPPAPEDKITFEENAKQKALHYATLSGLPTIASDGGLCIDALDGAPGIRSRRWSGRWTSDEELLAMVLEKLHNIPRPQRTARLALAIAFTLPSGETLIEKAAIEGFIAETLGPYPPGFPYRGLLLVEPFRKYYSELTQEEHEQVNHWRAALEEMKPRILVPLQ